MNRRIRIDRTPGFLRLITALLALSCTPLLAAVPQFPDEPYNVCPMEQFPVEWVGPGTPTDLIVIADIDAPPEARDYDFAEVTEGNPVLLEAPSVPGEYRIRYVDPVSNQIIGEEAVLWVEPCVACTVPEYPVEEYAVAVHAIQSSSGDKVIEHGPFTIDDLCRAGEVVGSVVGPIVSDIIGRAEAPLGVPIAVVESHVRQQLANAKREVCDQDEDLGELNWSTFVYSYCRLAAESGPYSMDIHLPPGTGDGTMSIADHNEQQVMRMTLKRNLQAASIGTGPGWSTGMDIGCAASTDLAFGYTAKECHFSYTMGLGMPGLGELGMDDMSQLSGPTSLGNFVSVNVEGHATMASCLPGKNILMAYQERLTTETALDDSSLGMFAGVVKNQVTLLEEGIPVDITSTSTGKIAGMPMVMGTDRTKVIGYNVIPMPAEFCTASLMPPDYEVMDVDEQTRQALAGASASGNQDSQELNDAMRQYNEAMQNMTPEQREAMSGIMSGMGMEGLVPGATSTGAGGGSGKVSSADLTTDNMVQSVQLHLQALGYTPGNTNGDLDLETQIAISEFEASKGRTPTGEASPIVLGILSAEVDSRR